MSHNNNQHIYGVNAEYIESLYQQYTQDPSSVSQSWQEYFSQLDVDEDIPLQDLHQSIRNSIASELRNEDKQSTSLDGLSLDQHHQEKQRAVLRLIRAYRRLGHRQADIDPLYGDGRIEVDMLSLEYHGLSSSDLDDEFFIWEHDTSQKLSLSSIINLMSTTYCGCIGSETEHISDPEQKRWLRKYLESNYADLKFSADKKKRILTRLISANALETYLHRKYVGQKRFSLEGGTSLIPMLDTLIQSAGDHSVKEAIIGMAHRGRLNVLVNIMGKSPQDLFEEFEGNVDLEFGSGDVKYHKGFSIDLKTKKNPIHAVLAFNPSHLEIINPVVEGSVRARQERRQDKQRRQVIPILIHGDAAFAGQGVVMETLNLSSTRGYTTGGTIHIVINNQIGFTTSDPLDSRSTLYCTDVAKMVQAPILHVNGDDPEAVVFAAQMAMDYRMKYAQDIVIDMICYRRHGHSEADEPAITQPLMYQRIRNKARVDQLYYQQLLEEGIVAENAHREIENKYVEKLNIGKPVCSDIAQRSRSKYVVDYTPFKGTHWRESSDTAINEEVIQQIGEVVTSVPEGFSLHRNVKKILDLRKRMASGELAVDWGFAEMLAYGSLLEQGYPIRLSGQDSVRGTFAHRHSAFHDQDNGDIYIPLRNLYDKQPQFLPINSLLSEAAVLGYEVGYATSEPNSLVIWEAQFGDFANNAQVIIDQFLSSSEVKWQRYCGLVLFLPHGYDGQGPEHSSARMERYLQLCAEENMQVCIPTTPAQHFHLLRRQMLRPYRKPLVVLTPKSLLRHPQSTSQLSEFTKDEFKQIITTYNDKDIAKVKRLLLCAGKVYFDLLAKKQENNLDNVEIIRIEQLYPFPKDEIKQELAKFKHVAEIVWVQEEPRNQGAWFYMQSRKNLADCIYADQSLQYAGRDYSASPAAGYLQLHRLQQAQLVNQALGLTNSTKNVELKSVS
ncbi:MAG: 2-oxoglutarate dehydrogenase E1 component [Gammaproteobacteria bacterium]